MTLIPESNHNLDTNGDLSKLKRTFTLPRNPFNSTRMSKRRPNNQSNNNNNNNNNNKKDEINENVVDKTNNSNNNNKRIFRRPSLKRFINKIAQHIGGVQVITNHQDNNHHHHLRVPPPYNLQTWGPNDTPGVTGIKNHGNTCFINAVLQCISNTDILAEYFVLDRYKIDLLKRNKLNSKKFGTKGEVTEQLALLLKALWACQYNTEISTNFKQVIERHGIQYKGNQQHDALEFLQWLLDKVHEDLNTASKRKYKSIKTAGRPDEVVAAETLENYKRCNNSFIQGIFQAQYRSSLSCSRCRTQSNTFDPFQCISVQLPQFNKQSIYVTVLYTSQQPRQVQIGLSIPSGATISELRDILESDTSIKRTNMLITEIGDNCFLRTFTDQQSINIISEIDPIYCIEVPQLKDVEDDCTSAYILLCWINVLITENGSRRFGSPYTMQVSRETSYDDLQKLILKEMAPILHDDILTTSQTRGVFKIRISDPACNDNEPPCYLEPELEHPLFMEAIDQSLALCCDDDGGPIHVKLILEFNEKNKSLLISDDNDIIDEHTSVKQLRQQSLNGGAPLTLEECLRDYTEAEILTDAWRCPHCQQYQPVVKTLDMWSLPEILVVHFKRFRQQTLRGSAKLTTMVDFPVNNLDMTPHLANKNNDDQSILLQTTNNWNSPWKHHHHHQQQQRRKESNINNNIYDLYGVCYHHGSDIETGHYTAACKNPYDHQWYLYDDAKVTNLSKQTDDINSLLVNNSAYILFYQRRNGHFISNTNTNCSSSNSSSSSAASTSSVSSSNNEHWVCRMPKFIPPKNLKNTNTNEKPKSINQNNNNKDIEIVVKKEDNQQEQQQQQQINEEVALKNSQNTLNNSNTNLKKSLENKSTNTINQQQLDENNDNKQQQQQQLYTTSIYINSCGEVNITTKQINDVDFIDDDDVHDDGGDHVNLTTMTEPERRKIYKTTAAVHRYSDNDRNITRTDLNWMSPQPVRKLNQSQQSV